MKKRFGSKVDEELMQKKAGLANAAKRRMGMGANQPGAKFGKVSGGGTKAAVSFAANSKGRFTPRTLTGRPVGDGAGPPDRVGQLGTLKAGINANKRKTVMGEGPVRKFH